MAKTMAVTVYARDYYKTYWKTPRGQGSWYFVKGYAGYIDFDKNPKEGVDYFYGNGKYSEVKKAAVAWAKAKGVVEISVCT